MAEEPDYYTFSFPVTVHPIQSPTRAATAYEQGDTTSKNALLFVGGLSDGPHVTWYLWTLAKKLAERRDLDYSIFEFRMRSSFAGFGASSLEKDVEDISAMVKHLRKIGRQKIILMGHSTGAQVTRIDGKLFDSRDNSNKRRIVWSIPSTTSMETNRSMASSYKRLSPTVRISTRHSQIGDRALHMQRA